MKTKLLILLSLTLAIGFDAQAGSATWSANPISGDWNNAVNWTPQTVPNGPTDLARFAGSTITRLQFSAASNEVAEIVFTPAAGSFNIKADSELAQTSVTLTISGRGLTNNSGVTQTLVAGPTVIPGGGGTINFLNAARAGEGTALTALGSDTSGGFTGSLINFYDTSSAATATIVAEGAGGDLDAGGGEVTFFNNTTADNASFTVTGSAAGGLGGEINFTDDSTAANATFTIEGGSNGGLGGEVDFSGNAEAGSAQFTVAGGGLDLNFYDHSTAADATFLIEKGQVTFQGFDFNHTRPTAGNGLFIINGGSARNDFGGTVLFYGGTGGNATLVANAGTNGGSGGQIIFFTEDESEAQFQLFGNATLIVGADVTVGSIEGDGVISVNVGSKLTIGNNDLSTTFSGTIEDFASGSLGKIGIGTLTLSGASTYPGGTTVTEGTLLVTNLTGSATGTGDVQVDGGTLGGGGTVSGAITVGTGSGSGSVLDPAATDRKIVTLVSESSLTFESDATYRCTIDFKNSKSTAVRANGVTINNAAKIVLKNVRNGTLSQGKVFKIIRNTSANPISGTFSNLADGAIVNVGGTNFQADYQGGDGNDLTLTIVP